MKMHGHSLVNGLPSATYNAWQNMKARCRDRNEGNYKGIEVCTSWLSFENFLADMGEKPLGTELDRIDNQKGYYKENCRWATLIESRRNTRRIRVTVEIAEEIRRLYKLGGRSCRGLGQQFGLAKGTVHDILVGRTWI